VSGYGVGLGGWGGGGGREDVTTPVAGYRHHCPGGGPPRPLNPTSGMPMIVGLFSLYIVSLLTRIRTSGMLLRPADPEALTLRTSEGIEVADGGGGGGGGEGEGGGDGTATVFVAGQYISLQEASADALESGAALSSSNKRDLLSCQKRPNSVTRAALENVAAAHPLQDPSLRDGNEDGGITGVGVEGREERGDKKSLCFGSAGGAGVEDERHLAAWRQFLSDGEEDAVCVSGVMDVQEDAVRVEDGGHLAAWRQFLSEGVVTDVEEDAVRGEDVVAQNSGGKGGGATGGGEASTKVPELSVLSQRVDPRTTEANETYNVSKRDLESMASSLSSASSVAHEHCNASGLLGAHTSGVEVEEVVGDIRHETCGAGGGGGLGVGSSSRRGDSWM